LLFIGIETAADIIVSDITVGNTKKTFVCWRRRTSERKTVASRTRSYLVNYCNIDH